MSKVVLVPEISFDELLQKSISKEKSRGINYRPSISSIELSEEEIYRFFIRDAGFISDGDVVDILCEHGANRALVNALFVNDESAHEIIEELIAQLTGMNMP